MRSMGSPNPQRFEYTCPTCGVTIAPYESFCGRHRAVGDIYEKPLLIDRIMHRLLGTGRNPIVWEHPEARRPGTTGARRGP